MFLLLHVPYPPFLPSPTILALLNQLDILSIDFKKIQPVDFMTENLLNCDVIGSKLYPQSYILHNGEDEIEDA